MRLRSSLSAAAALLAAGTVAVVLSLARYEDAYEWVSHTSDVRIVLGRALGRLDTPGAPPADTCRGLARDVDAFAELTRDNPRQQARVPELELQRREACAARGSGTMLASLSAADSEERDLLAIRRRRLASVRAWTVGALATTMLGALAIFALAVRIERRALAESRVLAAKLEAVSITDELTGLHNRRGFMLLAGHQLQLAQRQGTAAAVLFADLDGLKRINDQLGHDTGDRAIREFASVFRAGLRTSDVTARLGGDEFVALLYGVSRDQIAQVEHRLADGLAAHNRGSDLALSASFGVAHLDSREPRTLEQLLEAADQVMYEHKRASRAARVS